MISSPLSFMEFGFRRRFRRQFQVRVQMQIWQDSNAAAGFRFRLPELQTTDRRGNGAARDANGRAQVRLLLRKGEVTSSTGRDAKASCEQQQWRRCRGGRSVDNMKGGAR